MSNKTVTTRIVLKNDLSTVWTQNNPILLKGEIGIATDLNKFKIGDGATAWESLEWANLSSSDISDIVSDAKSNVYEYTRTDPEQTDNDAITEAIGENPAEKGDICIIKTEIDSQKYEYMAYVYNGSAWAAMSGNVNAKNVIFSEAIQLAGSYTSVGNINISDGTIESGVSVFDIMQKILTKELYPSKPTPTCSVTLSAAGAKEVGSKFTPSYSVSFDGKTYTYGTADSPNGKNTPTGCTASVYNVTDTNSNNAATASGSFSEFTVEDSTNYKVSATVEYTQGKVPTTNLGKEYPSAQVTAGTTAQASSSAVTGYRSWFVYVGTDNVSQLDSTFFRTPKAGITNKGAAGNNFNLSNLPIPAGTKRVAVAIPASKNKTLASVIDVDGMGLDVKGNFTTQSVQIEGANAYSAVEYDVFLCENAAGLAATKYTISFN